jgi:hypothetical protein
MIHGALDMYQPSGPRQNIYLWHLVSHTRKLQFPHDLHKIGSQLRDIRHSDHNGLVEPREKVKIYRYHVQVAIIVHKLS